jgi:putative ABC transport system permease protein
MLTHLRTAFLAIGTDTRLALRNIFRQVRRSIIASMAISFGVIAMMLSAGFIEWIIWANREGVAVTQLGHIQIVKPGYYEDGKSDPFRYLLPQQSPELDRIQDIPGVRTVTTRMDFNGLISHDDSTLSFLGQGIDPANDPALRYLIIVEGQHLSLQDPKGILVGSGLAANLGIHVGDTVVLLTTTRSGGMGAVEAHVRGLVSTTVKAYDDSMLRVPIELAGHLLRASGGHVRVISLFDTDMTDAVTKELRNRSDLTAYEISPWTALADFYQKTVELFSRQINVVKLIIAVIIVLSISNTMTMSVMERTVEIGTAMALGVKRHRILGLFLVEGGILGLASGIAGAVLGYLLAQAISAVGIPMPPAPGMSRGFTASIMVTPKIAGEAVLLAVMTTLLASIYPAWRASRLIIVDALRHNR